jgi:hypothetical protein
LSSSSSWLYLSRALSHFWKKCLQTDKKKNFHSHLYVIKLAPMFHFL